MKLEGFRCDECSVESNDKPGDWHIVQRARVDKGFTGLSSFFSEGLHFCSKACLIAHTDKWVTR